MAKMAMREQVARIICEDRGVDPDAPITITRPAVVVRDGDGERTEYPDPQSFDRAWEGYADLAEKIIRTVKKG